jgi:hypothetical protein
MNDSCKIELTYARNPPCLPGHSTSTMTAGLDFLSSAGWRSSREAFCLEKGDDDERAGQQA